MSSGLAFCGLVGAPDLRCEYGVMGASVNLAARLMVKAEDILCNDDLVREFKESKHYLSVAPEGFNRLLAPLPPLTCYLHWEDTTQRASAGANCLRPNV